MKRAFLIVVLVLICSFIALGAQPANLVTDPAAFIYFGEVVVGTSADQVVRISASGTLGMSVNIQSIQITDNPTGEFQVLNVPALPYPLFVGSFLDVVVRYTPTDNFGHSGNLVIAPVSAMPRTIGLSGEGRALAMQSEPPSWDFGCGSMSGNVTLWVSMNPAFTMSSSVSITSVTCTGGPGFTIGSLSNSIWEPITLPYSITGGMDSLAVLINFDPSDTDYVTGLVNVQADLGDLLQVPLTAFRGLVPNPMYYDFGDVTVGGTGLYSIVLSAQGPAGDSLYIDTLNFTPDDDFGFSSPYEGAMHLLSGENMTLDVGFFPVTEGPDSGELVSEYTRNGESTIRQLSVPLYGNGQPADVQTLSVTPTSHDFGGTIIPGETGTATFSVTRNPAYTGTAVMVQDAVLRGDPAFSLGVDITDATGGPITLPYLLDATGMAVFTVEFEPWTADYQSAVLSIYSDMGDSLNVDIEANGGSVSVGPLIEVNPTIVNVDMNTNSVVGGLLTISNAGTDDLIFNVPAALGCAEISVFPVNGTVAPGDSTQIQYFINSSSLTADGYTRTIGIESNDYGHSPTNITFNIGVNDVPEQVDFVGVPLSGHSPLLVQFTDQSFIDAQAWRWDFQNDGIVDSYVQNPQWTYSMPGIFSVKLVVISATGVYLECLKPDYITVTNTRPMILPGAFTEQEFMEDTIGGPYDLTEVFLDPDGDTLTYTVNRSDNIWGSATAAGALTLQATPDWSGSEDIFVVASDPFKGAITHMISVTVLPVNDPPLLSVPEHLYFIRNSEFTVDFSEYITDPDNIMDQLSISILRMGVPSYVSYEYYPVDVPDLPGQFEVIFSSLSQQEVQQTFRISVNDHTRRAIVQADFVMHVLEHFDAQLATDQTYQYTGQTVQFNDVTLGNPNYWLWTFGDGQSVENIKNPTHIYAQAGTYDVTLYLGHTGANEFDTIVMPGYITMYGTSVTDDNLPPNWTLQGSPYNLFGDIVIGGDDQINIEPNVEVNLFGNDPLLINGVLNATLTRFRPQGQNGRWGGLKFQGSNQREPSELIDCDIVDALLPIDIEDASPLISGVTITVSDTTQFEDSRGIRITGDSNPTLNNVELVNYRQGLSIENDGNTDRDTPTLTNIRVRNSSQTSRDGMDPGTGILITGGASLNNVLVDNFGSAIVIDGTEYNTTPTLTNIRVRNSSQTSRGDRFGIQILGGAIPSLDDVEIDDVSYGILVMGGGDTQRDTPTLTNIRVRNSSQTSRSETWGINIQDLASIELEDAEIEGFNTGILIRAQSRVESTPTLTNIRVRNSSQTSRQQNVGIDIEGSVTAQFDDVIVEDYPFGIIYTGSLFSRDVNTPTLTNIRVRNSSQSSRNLSTGVQLRDLGRIHCSDFIIEDCQIGLEITNSSLVRDASTPTLTNIRVRNSSQTSRYENAGIFLGNGVGGTLTGAVVEEAIIGIFVADGNSTRVEPAQIFNCETGIKAASSLHPKQIKRHLIVLEPAFQFAHQDWQFRAIEVSMPGPWLIENNTLSGYPKYVKAEDAGILFNNNIAWNTSPSMLPFQLQNSLLTATYNDMFVSPPYPGVGNIALFPEFVNPTERDFGISYDSPCIDRGSPLSPKDEDGTRADMGAFPYLHRASMVVSQRFVQPGTLVTFTNTSLGHSYQNSFCEWDLNKDGQPEGFTRDWAYTFNSPGVYNLRLRMHTGTLEDIRDYNAVVVVQSELLQGPPAVTIARQGGNIILDWEPVTLTQQGQPISVEYYLIYSCDSPDDYFDFVGNTQDYETIYTHLGGADADRRFYFVLGFTGTMRELQQFIEQNRRLRHNAAQTPQMRSKP